MTMHPATSTNVIAVGYEPSTRTMRVQFRSGGVYDYYGIDPHLFEQMLVANPWLRVGRFVRTHAHARVA